MKFQQENNYYMQNYFYSDTMLHFVSTMRLIVRCSFIRNWILVYL